jgi:hypothetical protein
MVIVNRKKSEDKVEFFIAKLSRYIVLSGGCNYLSYG